jgi:alkylated DNA repair dioxygenase AlkB
MKQRKKLIYVKEPPEGLFYIPRFLSKEQEQEILAHVSAQPFEPYDHHGYKANREVVYFGAPAGYSALSDQITKPMPDWLMPLRHRLASSIGLNAEELEMALVAQYAVGAGIGWHRDRPQFGPTVLGVSLASTAEMRFRRFTSDDQEEMFKIELERGSAYAMSGPARSVWQHGMIPVKQLRYSITFRTIRGKEKVVTDPRHSPEQIARRLVEKGLDFGIPTESAAEEQLKLVF